MKPKIIEIETKKFIGMSVITSFANDNSSELISKFLPVQHEIENRKTENLFFIQKYESYFWYLEDKLKRIFEKWLAIEVENFEKTPPNMRTFLLQGGKYAVFIHKGTTVNFHKTINFIFEEWIPESDWQIDNRPHLELLGEKYSPYSKDSEQEIWVPITKDLQ